jgi:hypothetical protein
LPPPSTTPVMNSTAVYRKGRMSSRGVSYRLSVRYSRDPSW